MSISIHLRYRSITEGYKPNNLYMSYQQNIKLQSQEYQIKLVEWADILCDSLIKQLIYWYGYNHKSETRVSNCRSTIFTCSRKHSHNKDWHRVGWLFFQQVFPHLYLFYLFIFIFLGSLFSIESDTNIPAVIIHINTNRSCFFYWNAEPCSATPLLWTSLGVSNYSGWWPADTVLSQDTDCRVPIQTVSSVRRQHLGFFFVLSHQGNDELS